MGLDALVFLFCYSLFRRLILLRFGDSSMANGLLVVLSALFRNVLAKLNRVLASGFYQFSALH